jgi:hypothetical protein
MRIFTRIAKSNKKSPNCLNYIELEENEKQLTIRTDKKNSNKVTQVNENENLKEENQTPTAHVIKI